MSNNIIIGAFSEQQANTLSGVSVNQLRSWDADGFFEPSYGSLKGVPYGRIYSFRDIVSLRVLNDLRNQKKIPLQHLREVSKKLSHLGDLKWSASTLFVLGKRVVFEEPKTKERLEVVSGQRVLNIPLRIVIANTRAAVAQLNNRENDVGKILTARFISQNEPVLAGTRIPVSSIKEFSQAGYTVAQIIREFPDLTENDIKAALDYQPSASAA